MGNSQLAGTGGEQYLSIRISLQAGTIRQFYRCTRQGFTGLDVTDDNDALLGKKGKYNK